MPDKLQFVESGERQHPERVSSHSHRGFSPVLRVASGIEETV
jgi:hypothetical protein